MQKFSEMGISYTPANGKEMLPGNVVRLAALQNKTIEVHKFVSGQETATAKTDISYRAATRRRELG